MEFIGSGKKLVENDFIDLAQELDIEPEIIHAVCEVESAGGGFLSDKRPKILFEAHVFYRETKGLYGVSNISSPVWDKKLYGKSGAHQYDRLHTAIHLDRGAGLRSASWGLFQIMGFNHLMVGYDGVEEFVLANMSGERAQLEMFGEFCRTNNLLPYLRDKDWNSFVRRYNGSGQVEYYADKLIKAYEKWKEKNKGIDEVEVDEAKRRVIRFGSKGDDVKELQSKLNLVSDGVFGVETMRKVKEFQLERNLLEDGIVGEITWNELNVVLERAPDNG